MNLKNMKESTTSHHKSSELYFNMFSCIHTQLLCSFFPYSYSFHLFFLVLLYLYLFLCHSLLPHITFSFYDTLTSLSSSHIIFSPKSFCLLHLCSHVDSTGPVNFDSYTYHIRGNITLTYKHTIFRTKSAHFDHTWIFWLHIFYRIPCGLQWPIMNPLHFIPHKLHQVSLKKLLILFHSWNLSQSPRTTHKLIPAWIIYLYSRRNHHLIPEEIIYLNSQRNHNHILVTIIYLINGIIYLIPKGTIFLYPNNLSCDGYDSS